MVQTGQQYRFVYQAICLYAEATLIKNSAPESYINSTFPNGNELPKLFANFYM